MSTTTTTTRTTTTTTMSTRTRTRTRALATRGARTRARAANPIRGPTLKRQTCDVGPLKVLIDNTSRAKENYSVISLTSFAVPGLLRSVAWVLNGMDVVVHECAIETSVDSIVTMTFAAREVRGMSGNKEAMIEDPKLVSDRLYDYLAFCIAGDEEEPAQTLREGGVTVDNTRSKDATYVSVRINEKVSSVISLYPIGSAFTGLGMIVRNGKLTSSVGSNGETTKSWEFEIVRLQDRKKLTVEELRALMYTLSLVCSSDLKSFGRSQMMTN